MKDAASEILVLPSWYPNKLDPLNGDFIQRHVKAIAIYRKQTVIFVVKDAEGRITKDVKIEIFKHPNLTERIIYYNPVRTGFKLLDKLLSQQKYTRIYKNEINRYITKLKKPELVHVHVALKAGMLALWIKNKWKISFILSEHWSGYFDDADHKINDLPRIYVVALKRIFKAAASVTVVSEQLGKAILSKGFTPTYNRIPNVVDTEIFFPEDKHQEDKAVFIHASTMSYPKNMRAIIDACKILVAQNLDFNLNLFGPINENLQSSVTTMGLQNHIFFRGEVSQPVLAKEMRSSDALILYSRFETFGCVIIEANASGIPVVVSDIPVFHELIKHNENGMIVAGDNPPALAFTLREVIAGKGRFNKSTISQCAEKFTFKRIGKQFDDLYNAILSEEQA